MRVWEAISEAANGGACRMIPAEFDYDAPDTLDEAIRLLQRGRRGRQAARRRPLAAAADEAPAGHAVAARSTCARSPDWTASSARTALADRGHDAARRAGAHSRPGAPGRGRRARSPTPRSATAARSAARSPTAIRPRTCPAVLLIAEGSVTRPGPGRRAHGRRRRPVPGLPGDGGRRRTRC